MSLLGPDYASYITGKNPLATNLYSSYTDLRVDQFSVTPSTVLGEPGDPGTIILRVTVSNRGNANGARMVVRFYDGSQASGGTLITELTPNTNPAVPNVPARCGGSRVVQYAWNPAPLSLGTHFIYAYVSSSGAYPEFDLLNNVAVANLTAEKPTPTRTPTPSVTPTPPDPFSRQYLPEVDRQ
jgi:hypothetical protein